MSPAVGALPDPFFFVVPAVDADIDSRGKARPGRKRPGR